MKSREDFTALGLFGAVPPILKLVVAIPLVAVYDMGVLGVLWADMVAWGLADGLALMWLVRRHRPALSGKESSDLLRVGSPVILHALSKQGLHMADRGILRVYRSLADVGVYHIAYAFGLLIEQAILLPLRQAWEPWVLRMDPSRREEATLPVLYGTLGICLIGSLGMGLLLDDLLALIVPGKFVGTEALVFPIALGYSLLAVFYQVDYRVLEAGRTWIYLAATAPAFILNLGLNFLLIPSLGGVGAAFATFLSMMVMTGLLFLVGRRHVSIRPGPLFRITGLFLIAVSAWMVPLRVPEDYLYPVLVEAFVLLATSVLILTLAPPSQAIRIFLRRTP
jgi:O-antigen/teichoic acid export membrane protein